MLLKPECMAHMFNYILHTYVMCRQLFAINFSWFCTHIQFWCEFLHVVIFFRHIFRFRDCIAISIKRPVFVFEQEQVQFLIYSLHCHKKLLTFSLDVLQCYFCPCLSSLFNCLGDSDFYSHPSFEPPRLAMS
jgi:hypothetical protein